MWLYGFKTVSTRRAKSISPQSSIPKLDVRKHVSSRSLVWLDLGGRLFGTHCEIPEEELALPELCFHLNASGTDNFTKEREFLCRCDGVAIRKRDGFIREQKLPK